MWRTIVVAFIAAVMLGAQTKPAERKSAAGGAPGEQFVITTIRVLEPKGAEAYLYGEAEVTFANIKETIERLLGPLMEGAATGKFRATGSLTLVYNGATGDMNTPFKLQVGVPVAPDTQAFGEYKVRPLETMRSATALFGGPVTQIGQAYQQVFTELFEAGLEPTGEHRETYYHFEAVDSPNNVVQIQIGVK